MSTENHAMYKLGQVARADGFGRESCNIPKISKAGRIKRAWWLAGWHDEDAHIEQWERIKLRAAS